jgi:N-methylhydantoinase B
MDRTKTRAWGLFGGGEGMSAHILVKRRGQDTFQRFSEAFGTLSDSKFTRVTLREGDEVLLASAGGGGYGDPLERSRDDVLEDVREGFVSRQAAEQFYRFGE